MFGFVKILCFICLVKCITSKEDVLFSTQEDFNEFYKNWAKSENRKTFRNIQATFMKASMNVTADPCTDFYQYACGNFGNVVPQDNILWYKKMTDMLKDVQNHLVKEVLAGKGDESETGVKVNHLLQSCLENSTMDYQVLGHFLKSFASWPLLDENWSEDKFDWLNLTAYARLYDIDLLFKQSVVYINGKFYNRLKGQYPSIGPAPLLAYIEHLVVYSELLSLDLEGKEDMLAEIIEFRSKLYDMAAESKLFEGDEQRYTLSELQEKIPGIDFRKYLKILRGKEELPLSEVVLFNNQLFFDNLVKLLAETNPRVIANYIFINMASNIFPLEFLAKQTPEGTCELIILQLMEPVAINMYARHYFNEDSYSQAVNIVGEIYQAGRKVINDSDFITNIEDKSRLMLKISTIKKYVAFPSYILRPVELNEKFADLHISPNSFVQNFINIRKHFVKLNQLKLGRWSKEFPDSPLSVTSSFSKNHKDILVLPVALLQPPFFHKYSPRFVSYGSVGAIAGRQLMHRFDLSDSVYNPGAESLDMSLKTKFFDQKQCLYLQHNEYSMESMDTIRHSPSTFSDNEGMKLALIAYKKWLQENGNPTETTNLARAGLNLNNIQAFFVSYAQIHCTAPADERLHGGNFARRQIWEPISSSDDFADAYNCPVGSKMNPETKCGFFEKGTG